MKAKYGLIAAAILGSIFSFGAPNEAHAFSGNGALVCNGCDNPSYYTLLADHNNLDFAYVVDFQARTIRYFYQQNGFWRENDNAITADVRDYWNLVLEFYDKNGGSLTYDTAIPLNIVNQTASIAIKQKRKLLKDNQAHLQVSADKITPLVDSQNQITAWDAVNEGIYRNQVVTYLNNDKYNSFQGMAVRLGMTENAISTLFGTSDASTIRINIVALGAYYDVTFPDGSTQRYSWDPGSASFQYVARSSKDAEGNSIPDDPHDVAGTNGNVKYYSYPATPQGSIDAINFWQRLQNFGFTSAPAPQTPVVIGCASGGSGPPNCTLSQ